MCHIFKKDEDSSMSREKWSSRSTFIFAAIGSAVGLGNAWRFPGLVAKHGGGSFLLVYIVMMIVLGIPILMSEIAIGRHVRQGAPGAMRALNKKAEPIGWIAVSNALVIAIYYAVLFAWVILMFIASYKFAGLTGDAVGASGLWKGLIKTTMTTSGYGTIAWPVLICLLAAWGATFWCIRNGTGSVGKIIKYIVPLPVFCLLILAIRGFMMDGAMEGMAKLFIPDPSAFSDSTLWVDAIGQVFYSMSVAMSIMFAYGSYLDNKSNIAVDSIIIAFADMLVSVIASVVMFTTMAGVGMLDNMSSEGISTAFVIYPQAIVQLTDIPWLNAAFGYVFYFCLMTLAIDSLFSIVEGASTAIADKFKLNRKKTTISICIIDGILGLFFITGAGLAWLDIVDNFVNSYTVILTGVLETVAMGWFFKTSKLLGQINRNTGKFKMPQWIYNLSIKYIAPVILSGLFIWNVVSLFRNGGIYGAGAGYSMVANIIGGWLIVALCLTSGFIIKLIVKVKEKKGFVADCRSWDEISENEAE